MRDHELRAKHIDALKLNDKPTPLHIENAFRDLSAMWSPSRLPIELRPQAEAKMIELKEARDWLIEDFEKDIHEILHGSIRPSSPPTDRKQGHGSDPQPAPQPKPKKYPEYTGNNNDEIKRIRETELKTEFGFIKIESLYYKAKILIRPRTNIIVIGKMRFTIHISHYGNWHHLSALHNDVVDFIQKVGLAEFSDFLNQVPRDVKGLQYNRLVQSHLIRAFREDVCKNIMKITADKE